MWGGVCVSIHALVIRYANRICCVPYCHLWPLWPYHVFSHCLINGTNFGNKFVNTKSVLILSTTFSRNISHSKKNSARCYHKCILVLI